MPPNTYETITLTIPIEDEYSFESLRQSLSSCTGDEIAKSTLYDWIKSICRLRRSGIYEATYSHYDFKILVMWIEFRSRVSRKNAGQKFRQFIRSQYHADRS